MTALNHALNTGGLSSANFDGDLEAAVNSSHLGIHHAVLFKPDSGNLAGAQFLIVDCNGVAGYQTDEDLVIRLDGAKHLSGLHAGDFTVA